MNIDHLVYTSPDLKTGMDKIEALLGVRPIIGGRHHNWGTHNALVSLGDAAYLEIISPDPTLDVPDHGRLFASHYQMGSRLTTWALNTNQIEALHEEAKMNGIQLGPIEAGKRKTPDGATLSWQLSDPYALPFEGALPFLISWGSTPHPSSTTSLAGQLRKVYISHPQSDKVKALLYLLKTDIEVVEASAFTISAIIATAKGDVLLS